MAKAKRKKASKAEAPEGMKCYQKKGGGSLRFPNRIIKSNQKFYALPQDIPDAHKDQIVEVPMEAGLESVSLKAKVVKAAAPKQEVKVPVYRLEKHGEAKVKGKWLYDVVAEDGKVMTEEPLGKGKAEALIDTLTD